MARQFSSSNSAGILIITIKHVVPAATAPELRQQEEKLMESSEV